VLIEYRLADVATYPAAPIDVAAAIEWIRSNAKTFDIASERLALAGGSAGGHLAALVGLATELFNVEGPIQAIAGFNGIYDLRDDALIDDQMVRNFLGAKYDESPGRYEEASPITHVDATDPPTILFHGTEDRVAPYRQAERFHDELANAGVPVSLAAADGVGHGYFNDAPWYTRSLAKLWSFLDAHI
jgi:acetyl esterase/lipase